MQLTPGKLLGMRRMSDDKGLFKMVAADQRPPITGPIAKQLGLAEAPWEEVAKFKAEIVTQLQGASSAILLDPYYGIPAAFDKLASDKGLVVTLEDSVFSESTAGRFSKNIDHWTVNKIKRLGGDAVKVLVWYRPDASSENLVFQQDYVKRVGEECQRFDIPFLLELLLYPLADEATKSTGYAEMKEKNSDLVLASIEEFAKEEYGVDLFKLESPVNANMINSLGNVQELFNEMGRLAGRPWVMLSAGAEKESFQNILLHIHFQIEELQDLLFYISCFHLLGQFDIHVFPHLKMRTSFLIFPFFTPIEMIQESKVYCAILLVSKYLLRQQSSFYSYYF